MSKFSRFMKSNKVVKKNEMYAATKSLCDENPSGTKTESRWSGNSGILHPGKTKSCGTAAPLTCR